MKKTLSRKSLTSNDEQKLSHTIDTNKLKKEKDEWDKDSSNENSQIYSILNETSITDMSYLHSIDSTNFSKIPESDDSLNSLKTRRQLGPKLSVKSHIYTDLVELNKNMNSFFDYALVVGLKTINKFVSNDQLNSENYMKKLQTVVLWKFPEDVVKNKNFYCSVNTNLLVQEL